jgi:hypothetical protein
MQVQLQASNKRSRGPGSGDDYQADPLVDRFDSTLHAKRTWQLLVSNRALRYLGHPSTPDPGLEPGLGCRPPLSCLRLDYYRIPGVVVRVDALDLRICAVKWVDQRTSRG